mmetsp:Transcript_27557/g.83891  ORF Transcript_27557/g.83891 Transcript_27557/m.83891 type:complete len:345 (-) Transcript_27557:992-2026(-)
MQVKNVLWPANLFRPARKTGMSWQMKLILVILYIEYLSMLIGVGILSTAGVGSVGYPYISYFLLWIAVPKFLVAMLLLLEFVRRRYYESPNDMFTALPSGRAVSVRDELTKLVREHANGCTKTVSAEAGPGSHPTPYAKDASRRRASQRAKGARVARLSKAGERAQKRHSYTKLTGLSVEGGGELCDHARFSIEAKQLVTGKPRDAALGVNFYMKVQTVAEVGWRMPPLHAISATQAPFASAPAQYPPSGHCRWIVERAHVVHAPSCVRSTATRLRCRATRAGSMPLCGSSTCTDRTLIASASTIASTRAPGPPASRSRMVACAGTAAPTAKCYPSGSLRPGLA